MIRARERDLLLAVVLFICALFVGVPQINVAFAAEQDKALISGKTSSAAKESGVDFSLSRCIEIALAKNPEIAAAQWDIQSADSRRDAAWSAFWPQMSIEGGYMRYVDPQRMIAARFNGELGVFDDDLLRGDVVAKMSLYSGGRISSEAGSADRLFEAEKKRIIRTKDELIYSVTGVYFSILGQQRIITSLEFSRKALEENLKRVHQLYENNKVAKVDVLRTEVRLADLNQNIIKEGNTQAVQKRILFSLMGYDTVPEHARFDEEPGLPVQASIDVGQLIESALKTRPDYQAAQDRMDAQALRVTAAKAGHLPSINLVGTYGMRNSPSPADRGLNKQSTEDAGSLGVFLTVPLFEGGRVSAKVREESAVLEALRERLKRLELQIRQETDTAALDVLSSTARFQATEKAVEQAKESFRIESLKYDLGKGSITDVLDAQSALLQAETNYCRACVDYHISMARLRLATGGVL
jgi:AhpD family alkylhydroperoxidase